MKTTPRLALLLFGGALLSALPDLPGSTDTSGIPPELPRPVASFGATATADGTVFLYGGHAGEPHQYNRDDVVGTLLRWQPGQSQWEVLAEGEPSQGASLLLHNNSVIRIGGLAARNSPEEDQDLWSTDTVTRFSIRDGSASELPPMPRRRSSHDSVIVGDTLYVLGGWTLEGGSGRGKSQWHGDYLTLDLSDPEAEWQTLHQPFFRRAIAAVTDGSRVLVLGGMDDGNDTSTEVWVLDTLTGEWSQGPALPDHHLGGFGFSSIEHEDRVLASGLQGHLLELVDETWVPISQMEHPRYFHRLLPAGKGRLIAVGGALQKRGKAPPESILLPPPGTVLEVENAEDKESGNTQASNWPGFQGPRGDGTTGAIEWSHDWGSQGPKEAWRAEVGVGLASLAVVGNRVYTAGNNGKDVDTFFCLDLDSGDVAWKHELPVVTAIHKMPIVPYGPAATPTVHDGAVYHLTRAGDLLKYNAENGDVIWQTHLVDDLGGVLPVYGFSSSPALHEGRLYLDIGQADTGSNPGSTVCLDAEDGSVIWQTGEGQAGYATPIIAEAFGKESLILFKGEALEIRQPDSGDLVARYETTTRDFCNCATPIVTDDGLFISHTGDAGSRLLQMDNDMLEVTWSIEEHGLLFHSGLPYDGGLLAFNDENRNANDLRLIDLETGESRWTSEDLPKGNAVLCDDGRLVLLSREGELVVAQATAEGITILQQVQVLGGKSYIQPVVTQNHILCRNNDGEIVCLQVSS